MNPPDHVRWRRTLQTSYPFLVVEIRQFTAEEARPYVGALAGVLLDCVQGGASVSFMASFSKADAESFFENILEKIRRGDCILLAAFADSKLVGTVQLLTATPPNQPHRADVAKLLVLRSARGQGIARRLMKHVEEVGRLAGKTLLVLDTATGDAAEKLYTNLGWNRVGVIPRYALYPDGTWCDTTIFWKHIASQTNP
jgi:GNAT superfamily N-acetyltransferase